jgi:hypothetical protein
MIDHNCEGAHKFSDLHISERYEDWPTDGLGLAAHSIALELTRPGQQ